MDTDQVMLVDEKETEEESSAKHRERCVCENKVKLSPFQRKHMGNVEFIGVHKEKTGKFGARIRDPITKKRVWLGTFNTAEEASKAYLLKKQEFLATLQFVNKPSKGFNFSMGINKVKEPISCAESSCLMASVHGTKSSDRCFYTVTNHPKAKRSLLGIPRRKNGWTANVARDLVRCKKVWLTTSETKSCDQIEPESPVGASLLSVDNDQTVYAASFGTRNERIDSYKTTHIIGAHKKKSGSRYTSEIRNPISKKRVWLGSFDTAEEASQAYQSKKLEFQKLVEAKQQCISKIHTSAMADQDGKEKLVRVNSGNEPIVCAESSKEASSLMANVHGTKSSDGCIYSTVTSNPEAKRNLLQIRRQNNGRYAARIADPIMHKKVWLGTSDTVVEDSEAYFSKKSEHEKLSKGNKENKTKNCDQTQPESPVGPSLSMDEDQTLSTAFVGTENNRTDSHRTTHIIGVHKRKSGRYTSEIRNPISKKKIWLGSFVTAEEASQAYQSKKLEYQKLVETKQQHNRQTHSSARAKQDGKEKLVDVKQGHETVNREGFQPKSSCEASGSLEIEVPMSNSSNGGSDQRIESHEISHSLEVHMRKSGKCTSEVLLGTLGTAEEALNAYQCKKPDFERSKKAELQDKMPTDSSAGTNRKCPEDEDLWMGQWVQLPGNREIKFSLKLGVPIIDNYGCLLGEFSSLDDLRIC